MIRNYKYVHTMHCTVSVVLFYDSLLKSKTSINMYLSISKVLLIKEVRYINYFQLANQFTAITYIYSNVYPIKSEGIVTNK